MCQLISFNNYFPNEAIRVYIDWYTLEHFKLINADKLVCGNLFKIFPSIYYEEEDVKNDVNESFKRFNQFIDSQNVKFNNAYEKFIYYFFIASKIYNSKDNDITILNNNKHADFFVYKFTGPFIEKINSYDCHITNGYIGQLIRYICLRQTDYTYNTNITKRNKHYVWRDAHANQTALNDSLIIKMMNDKSKSSTTKIFNLIPSNHHYTAPWHSYAECPTDPDNLYVRSAIAGIVQMTNFRDEREWFDNLTYLQFIGIAFISNNKNDLASKKNREPFLHIPEYGHNGIKKEYNYGIEENLFNNIFILEKIKIYNIYYPDKFADQIQPYADTEEKKAALILFNYIKNELEDNFSMFEIKSNIEKLRNNKTGDTVKDKWLSYLLSIYPTKYFISSTIFNINFYDRGSFNDAHLKKHSKEFLINKIKALETIYREDNFNNYSWDLLNKIGLNCNTPIMNSSIEWCINPYLNNISECPPDDFFSGFYNDNPKCIEYGLFRNPTELGKVINYLDSKLSKTEKVPIYKNIMENKTPSEYFRGGDMYHEKYLKYKNKYISLKNKI